MKLPIKIDGKTYYMDSDDWEAEQEWMEERVKNFHKPSREPFKRKKR